MKLTLNNVFFALFVSVWALLIIGNFLTPEKEYSESENRVLASMPDFSTETLLNGKYMQKLETYTNDQFLLRGKWITLKNLTEQAMLKTDSNGVYFARDGYLIQKHDAPDEERAEKNKVALASFASRAATELGSDRVRVMLVPTAFEILDEKLPPFASGFDQLAYNASVAENLPQDVFLDVSGTLAEHSDEYIYYRTDHHWTTLGAYYAYD